jgi:hypothetical protein
MDWTAPIDIYCERLGPGFWAEPINALSNLAFLVAALVAAVIARRQGVQQHALWALVVLATLIGVGSFLFHTYATPWAALADVLPIWTFVVLYLATFATQVAGIRPLRLVFGASLALIGLAAAMALFEALLGAASGALNGSEQYAPALLALAVFSVILIRRRHPQARLITATTGVFTLSLIFRTLDVHLCGALPHGTHFLWHILNGTVIGMLLIALIRGLAAPVSAPTLDDRHPDR